MWNVNGKTWYSSDDIQKIIDHCNSTIACFNAESGYNAYAGGRCTEAELILQIIKEIKQ